MSDLFRNGLQWMRDQSAPSSVYVTAASLALVGLLLWGAGSAFSRAIVTLTLVVLAACIGLRLPSWMGWKVEGWATAIGAVVIVGGSGILLHRFWVACGMGALAAIWAVVIVWCVGALSSRYVVPDPESIQLTAGGVLKALWAGLPADVAREIPWAAGISAMIGIGVGLIWPKMAVSLLYAWTGASLLLAGGYLAIGHWRPDWLAKLPKQQLQRSLVFAAFVLFGAVMQWRIVPKPQVAQGPSAMPASKAGARPMSSRSKPVVLDV